MRTVRNILIGLFAVFAMLTIIALFLPSKKHIDASILIQAPVSIVYEQVNNFTNWEKWSPWATRDSQMISTYEGPDAGIGAITRWNSPMKQTGNGSMEIKDAQPCKSILIELKIMGNDPSLSPWLFEESEEGTRVTWGLDMQNMNLMERYFGLFMQNMMDPYFKQGLDSLKAVSEKLAENYTEQY